jgi:hypothetical protein
MTLIATTTQTVNDQDALVLHAEQSANGVAHESGSSSRATRAATVMLIGITPKSADAKPARRFGPPRRDGIRARRRTRTRGFRSA